MENLVKDVKSSVKYWWVSLLIGLFAIVLGVVAMVVPAATLVTLSMAFGWIMLLSGVLMAVFAVSNRKVMAGWGWYMASAVIDMVIGLFLVVSPEASIVFLLTFVGVAILFQSVWAIGGALDLQMLGSRRWGWLLALAILGVLFSFLLILRPDFAAGFIVVLFGIALIVYGVFRISYAVDMKRFGNDIKRLKKHMNDFFRG